MIKTSTMMPPASTQIERLRYRLAIYTVNIINRNAPTKAAHKQLINRARIVANQIRMAEAVAINKTLNHLS